MSERTLYVIGALTALLAVAAGAFGAHLLEGRIEPERLGTWETAARYQMYHALALLVAARASARWPRSTCGLAGTFFLIGMIIFSGTCYALALGGPSVLGAVTPFGGLSLMIGWGLLAWGASRG